MKQGRALPSVVATFIAIVVLANASQRILAQGPKAPSLVGHYVGLYVSSIDATQTPTAFTIDLYEQHGNVATGSIRVGTIARAVPAKAFYQEKDRVSSQTGEVPGPSGSPGARMAFDGELIDLGGGTLGMVSEYTIGPPGNPIDRGTLYAVQCNGAMQWSDLSAPDVTGCWFGKYGSGEAANLTADFDTEVGSQLSGLLRIGVFYYAFVGTVSPDGAIKGMATTGNPLVRYVTISGQLQAGAITGTIHYVFLGGTTEDDPFWLIPCLNIGY